MNNPEESRINNSEEDLNRYCARGAKYELELIYISEKIKLRLITFRPARETQNPAVVFIAGWITQIVTWKEVLQEMTRDFTVYYLETREKISSQITRKAEYSVQAIARDISDFIAQKELHNYMLFGSSLGATAIIDCFASLKSEPKALVLINPNAEFRVPKFWVLVIHLFYPPFYFLIKPVVKWYLRNFRMDLENDLSQYQKYSQALDAADPWKLKKAMLSLRKYKIWDLLPGIDAPTLFIGASKDSLHEPEKIRKMNQTVQDSTLLDMETNSATHSKEMVEKVREFLKTIE